MKRYKNPAVDLKLAYRRVMARCVAISFLLLLVLAVMFPTFEMDAPAQIRPVRLIFVEPTPVTRQLRRTVAERPAVPVEAESDEVPEDVTIEPTELNLDRAPVDLPPPARRETAPIEEEVLEFWHVERRPVLTRSMTPAYPEVAMRAGLEGDVFVAFTVGAEGSVRDVRVLRGPDIFRKAAVEAVSQFLFEPAVQNDRPVAVKMTMPIRFRLSD